jgi:hypothetical protein
MVMTDGEDGEDGEDNEEENTGSGSFGMILESPVRQ